jgi:hypothetical protein
MKEFALERRSCKSNEMGAGYVDDINSLTGIERVIV